MSVVVAGYQDENGLRYGLRQNGGYLHGIDVSHHQKPGTVDLTGQQFGYVRCAYGDRVDNTAQAHAYLFREAGLLTGGYLFFRQKQDRAKQLMTFLEMLGESGQHKLAPVVDLEWNTYDGTLEPDAHNTHGRWICEQLANRFGRCVVYIAPAFWEALGKPQWVGEHAIWLAHYTEAGEPRAPGVLSQWAIHQWQGEPLDRNVARYLPLVSEDP